MLYPLYWQYRDQIVRDGISAAVVARGRCLMVHEDGEFWIRAVEPGGFCAHGAAPAFAMKAFQIAWTEVLEDCAFEKQSFQEFEAEVRAMFESAQISRRDEEDWNKARSRIQAGAPIEGAVGEMQKVHDDLEAFVQVVPLEQAADLRVESLTGNSQPDEVASAA